MELTTEWKIRQWEEIQRVAEFDQEFAQLLFARELLFRAGSKMVDLLTGVIRCRYAEIAANREENPR